MQNGLLHPYKFSNRLLYLINESGLNINKRGFTTILSTELFKKGIIEYTNQTNDETEKAKQRDSVRKRIDEHLKLDSADNVSGIWLHRYCNYFKCSSDFLFGLIDLPEHTHTDIQRETNLSEEAIKRITNHENRFLNTLILSKYFWEMDCEFDIIYNDYCLSKKYAEKMKELEEEYASSSESSVRKIEINKLYDQKQGQINRAEERILSSMYRLGLMFGNIFEDYRLEQNKHIQAILNWT